MVFWEIWAEGKKVGYLSLKAKVVDMLYEVGNLMLFPGCHGKGYMTMAVKILSHSDYGERYFAEVKFGNSASRHVFTRAGFREVGKKTSGHFLVWQYERGYQDDKTQITLMERLSRESYRAGQDTTRTNIQPVS
jgi:hypothetical protein